MAQYVNICWEVFGKSVRCTLLNTGLQSVFSVGDSVTFEGRPDDSPHVIITKFTGEDPNGPLGFCYLPWRAEKQCWATQAISLKGDPRHIICYPVGIRKYGMHIDWNNIRHINAVNHPVYTAFVEKLVGKLDECKHYEPN